MEIVENFENLHRHWNDLFYINERVGSWTEKELAPLEEKLRADITGENDVAYSGKDDEV